jgi:enterobacterial common antigen flippase
VNPPAESLPPKAQHGSYRQILKATSLLGGAAAINMMISLVRGKVGALTLGPAGLGVMGAYISVTGLVAIFAAAGLGASGVREVAEAVSSGDEERAKTTIHTYRYLSLWLSLLGTLALALGAPIASQMVFENGEHTLALAVLAVTVGAGVSGTYYASLVQAAGQLGRTAKSSVMGALFAAIVSVVCFVVWRRDGIVPSLVVGSLLQLAVAWWMARDLSLPKPSQSTRVSWSIARRMLSLGGYLVFIGLMQNFAGLVIRRILFVEFGEDAAGQYQSAGGLSMMFASFILGAMGTDFMPRLSAVANDHNKVNQMVNEQTSVALLMGLPGVVGTILLAPFLMPMLYSTAFSPGVGVLQLLSVGVFARLLSWPMYFILLTKQAIWLSFVCEIFYHVAHIGIIYWGARQWGLDITGWGSIGSYIVLLLVLRSSVRKTTGFRWSKDVLGLVYVGVLSISAALVVAWRLPPAWNLGSGVVLFGVVSWFCVQQISKKSGFSHIGAIDWLKRLAPLKNK